MIKDLHTLPDNLPVPIDDGACDHLVGRSLPSMPLASTAGHAVDLRMDIGTQVIYCYPMLGRPDGPPLVGWNEIPGARGCTPQACAFRDRHAEFTQRGVAVFGVSTQPLKDQQAAHARLHLPFVLLNDERLAFAQALRLPTFEYAGARLIQRLTVVAVHGRIVKVWYPVFPPDTHAAAVLAWLAAHPA